MFIPDKSQNFAKIFHTSSKDNSKRDSPLDLSSGEEPESWNQVEYKQYPRFDKIALPDTSPETTLDIVSFFDVVKGRESQNDFISKPLSVEEISLLLRYSCGIISEPQTLEHRAQPSAGARFPLEVYVAVMQNSDKILSGLYHYNVRSHALEKLLERLFTDKDIGDLFNYSWVKKTSAVFFITAIFERTQRKYGERGYRHVFLEAGHVGQNIYLISKFLGLKCCALAGTKDINVETFLNIDGSDESLVYTLTVGR